ncbi:MAG: prepilin peptidase [Gaiellales bacterium]|nr:prepilin peptidase [Gaiellales bacterium]
MQVAAFAVCFLVGLAVGSFLNVVAYRVPRGESVVTPGSHCPACGHAIRWYDNVPLIGWIRLKGRCRDCGAHISPAYVIVELVTGVLFAAAYAVAGPDWRLLVLWVLLAVLVAVALIDVRHMIIPNAIVLPGAVVLLGFSIVLDPAHWWHYVAGGLGAAAFLLAVALIWPGGMGMGDVKLALMMGSALGGAVIVALFSAFLVGGVAGVGLIASGKKTRKDKIPFGPFLAVGGVVGGLAGTYVLDWYLRLW